jgi:hypothetical protein
MTHSFTCESQVHFMHCRKCTDSVGQGFWFPDVNSVFQYTAAVQFKNSCSLPWSQDSIVNIETRPQAGDQEIVWFPATARDVSLLPDTQTSFWGPSLLNTLNTTSRVAGTWSWPHIHTPSSAKKNEGSYIFTLPYALLVCRRTDLLW